MKSDLVDVVLYRVRDTPKAYGVREYEAAEELIWRPKSLVEVENKVGSYTTFTMPESLAYEKGLI